MEKENKGRGKRKRPYGESSRVAYSSFAFTPREWSEHPRSPSRFFKHSFDVQHNDNTVGKDTAFKTAQIVHHHVNGLCIVTCGETLPSDIEAVQLLAKEAPATSAAEKRKRQAKMLKGGKVEHATTPDTVLAELQLKSGETVPLYACVWGTIIEMNNKLTKEKLLDDPLLDGYLAVILPSGTFPPKADQPSVAETALEPTGVTCD